MRSPSFAHLKDGRHVVRNRGSDDNIFPREWVRELGLVRVQQRPPHAVRSQQFFVPFGGPVRVVANDRCPALLQMNADLVRPPGLNAHQRGTDLPVECQRAHMGQCGLARRPIVDRHQLPVFPAPPDGFDDSGFTGVPHTHGQVHLADVAFGEESRELGHCLGVLGCEQHTGRALRGRSTCNRQKKFQIA